MPEVDDMNASGDASHEGGAGDVDRSSPRANGPQKARNDEAGEEMADAGRVAAGQGMADAPLDIHQSFAPGFDAANLHGAVHAHKHQLAQEWRTLLAHMQHVLQLLAASVARRIAAQMSSDHVSGTPGDVPMDDMILEISRMEAEQGGCIALCFAWTSWCSHQNHIKQHHKMQRQSD
jgi:hypothetical protein